MLRVCHIASGDTWGGAEAQVATLIKTLAQSGAVDVCAIILNEGRLAQELRALAIEVRVISERHNSLRKIFATAQEFIAQRAVHIIHSHRYKENLLAVWLAAGNPKLRLVRTQHGLPEKHSGIAGLKQKTAYAIDRFTGRFSANKAIAVSEDVLKYLTGYISADKVRLVPNGIDLNLVRCPWSKSEAKKMLGIGKDEFVIGFAGRLERVKRPDLFISVCRHLVSRSENIRFVVAGDGRLQAQVESLIGSFGLTSKVLLLGHRNDSYAVLRAMDLLLLTSDHEGMPMVMLEAMWLGTPVASRAVGGVIEVIVNGETGILLQDADPVAIAETCLVLQKDPALREKISSAARTLIARKYSATRNCDLVLDLYSSLTSQQCAARLAIA